MGYWLQDIVNGSKGEGGELINLFGVGLTVIYVDHSHFDKYEKNIGL